jgi:hypothetical protein
MSRRQPRVKETSFSASARAVILEVAAKQASHCYAVAFDEKDCVYKGIFDAVKDRTQSSLTQPPTEGSVGFVSRRASKSTVV